MIVSAIVDFLPSSLRLSNPYHKTISFFFKHLHCSVMVGTVLFPGLGGEFYRV